MLSKENNTVKWVRDVKSEKKGVRVRGKGWVAILNKVISIDLVKMVASELEMKEMKRLTM